MKRTVEIFTAGCPFCEPVVELVQTVACNSCEVSTHNLADAVAGSEALRKAREYGVQALPAVAVNGVLLACCQSEGITRETLKQAGIGQAA
ncbi:conserved hypothetical protein [Hymenobacter roseosalivarius DSM 11622]|uniref:Thioredoxin-like fold domain-containing protein n=1 Tax=Hymenobacter roseosalivarius DSM 11622 TaxID=645990 RepID=A0A1W1W1Q8_9BACT|nr:thioredoxin family protein [Hymenobacter roseosalivarius]SMB99311.1 conserved hypothetical protein [Hymenobacter roseosalivarius DSM 11622]